MAFKRNRYNPDAHEPFRISRSKIDLYVECPRCFWLDQRMGVTRPSMPGFSLNNAVDALLKREFDAHRAVGTAHPYMMEFGVDALPFKHERMEEWRDALRRGVTVHHAPTNLMVRGGVDDVWVDPAGALIIVDYKATSTVKEISLDDPYKQGYKRQLEIYQWLFRGNGFTVSPTGYFVFVNGDADRDAFDGKLTFAVQLIPYTGDDGWIDGTLRAIKTCLDSDMPPSPGDTCEHCEYRETATHVLEGAHS